MSILGPLVLACLLFTPTPTQASDSVTQESSSNPMISARLVSSRPRVRPGEWFPVVLLLESESDYQIIIGPADDGLRAAEGVQDIDTKLNWETESASEYPLVPDLTAIQWPRSPKDERLPKESILLPASIYIPVRAVPDARLGMSTIGFSIQLVPNLETEGVLSPLEPIKFSRTVDVEIVHPTNPEVTDLTAVDQTLFFGWHGELPDWSVRAAQPMRGVRKPAPILAWILVGGPFVITLTALTWAFVTKRL